METKATPDSFPKPANTLPTGGTQVGHATAMAIRDYEQRQARNEAICRASNPWFDVGPRPVR